MTLQPRFQGPLSQLDPDERDALLTRESTLPEEVRETVHEMANIIREQGDKALLEYTERFDDVQLDALEVPRETIQQAFEQAPARFTDAFETVTDQVRSYHEALTIRRSARFAKQGIDAHERVEPIPRAGLYVPGGEAAYPSTVAMTVIPARVAGVDEITVASPPGPDGIPHPLVLAACHMLDVDRVVPLGGAQAILALALGTLTIPRHDVVAGPGNAYVQAAKEHVAGRVRIDSPAGPSEVAALVGSTEHARTGARELAAQAEHAADTQPVALCQGPDVADRVHQELDRLAGTLERGGTIRQALEDNGALLTVDGLDEATRFLDELAPEHCVLYHEEAPLLATTLTGPACIVTGPQARVPLADYGAGPSHVLPTGGSASAFSGLGLETFTKRVHVVDMQDPDPGLVQAAATLARLEGLTGHALTLDEEETP